MKAALLIIDMQKKFYRNNQVRIDSLNSASEYINAAIIHFRKKNLPVFVIQHKNEEENLVPGTLDFEVLESLKLKPQDQRIIKTYSNSFIKTGLMEKLKAFDVDTLIITGFCAEFCVLSTYKGAEDLDLKPIILRGSIASDNTEHIRFVEEITETITYGALTTLL